METSVNWSYRLWLVEELTRRTRKNPAYSLRSFSRSLGVSPASLSQVISGKRKLTKKTALQIIERCGMTQEEGRSFLTSALGKEWTETLDKLDPYSESRPCEEMEVDRFRALSDWYHIGILGLSGLKRNSNDPQWIANELAIPEREAIKAFDRLLRLGLIKKVGKSFQRNAPFFHVSTNKSHSVAIRKYHKQNLHKAEEALERQTTPLEMFSSITMPVDESQLEKARELIAKFRNKLCHLVEEGQPTRVYTLSVQLFPISRGEEV